MTGLFASVSVKVWGDWALFTRPEMKAERVSYSVMTPSAARGILESIFWKPQMAYTVDEIWVLEPVRYFSIVRNEVNGRASERAAREWQAKGGGYDATDRENREQRHSLALRKVAYVIHASIAVRPGVNEHPAKYREQFERRVQRGQCFTRPYLGCREFAAAFAPPTADDRPLHDLTGDLGSMLLDLDYATDGSGRGTPRFFLARLDGGVLRPQATPTAGGLAQCSCNA